MHAFNFQPCKCIECISLEVVENEDNPSDNDSISSFNSNEEIAYYAAKCYDPNILDQEEAYFHDVYPLHSSKGAINRKQGTGFRRRKKKESIIVGRARLSEMQPSIVENKSKTDKTRSRSKKHKSKERRRQITRRDGYLAQLQARKDNIQERIKPLIGAKDEDSHRNEYVRDEPYNQVLPANELGVDEGEKYERLLEILEGDEITPEDYELLLQLDTNNKKSTLSQDSLDEIPILVIGGESKSGIAREDIESSQCDICFEAWGDLENGTQLRCLPCRHTFCKECIDHWLKEVSNKCPNLSCFWCKD